MLDPELDRLGQKPLVATHDLGKIVVGPPVQT